MKGLLERLTVMGIIVCISSTASALSDFEVFPRVLSFTAHESGGNPESDIITVANFCNESLNWQIADVNETTLLLPDWLSLSPISGLLDPNGLPNNQQEILVSVQIDGLADGHYSCDFKIIASGTETFSHILTVYLEVTGPMFELSSNVFDVEIVLGSVCLDSNELIISNTGGGTLNWFIADANEEPISPPDWLSISPTNGVLVFNQSEIITLSYHPEMLSAGHYSYSFQVVCLQMPNTTRTVTVDLEVVGPKLDVSSNTISFTAYEAGVNPALGTLTVSNSRWGVLGWTINDTDKPNWLTIAPISGSLAHAESDEVTLQVDINRLPVGHYSYSFEVSAPDAQNSPRIVTVDLDVHGPALNISSNTFLFEALEAGANPDDQILTIKNTGGGVLDWTIDDTGKPNWLTIAPTSGSLEHAQSDAVTLSVDMSNLTVKNDAYSFDISALSAQNSPQTVDVEFFIYGPFYVDDDALNDPGPFDPELSDPLEDGSAEHPFDCIMEAFYAADSDNTIIVLPGRYVENITFYRGRNIILTSIDPEDPAIVENTIIDGGRKGPVIQFWPFSTSSCQLRGFTITNGSVGIAGAGTQATITHCIISDNSPGGQGSAGGLDNCDGVIANCTIINNRADSGGGISRCDGSITNCIVTGNVSGRYGGGLANCDAVIRDCTITGNTAIDDGGGLANCDGMITNCTISENMSSDSHGGGLYWCQGAISYCTIIGNTAGGNGGGLASCNGSIINCVIAGNRGNRSYGGGLLNCDGSIINCTMVGNSSPVSGGALAFCDGAITNCVIWKNHQASSGDQLYGSSEPDYSCVQDWTGGGEGNVSDDPSFSDMSGGPMQWDLCLLPGSSCIDSGTNTPAGGLPETDIEGFPRPFDGDYDGFAGADIGAYEFHIDPSMPYLHVTRRFYYFSYIGMEGTPEGQCMNVTNFGNQTLNWTINLSDKPDWLTVTPASGSLGYAESDEVTVSVDASDLPVGQFRYSFKVADPAAQNEPQTVTIQIVVCEAVDNVKYVIQYGPNDPGLFNPAVSDPLEDGSVDHPFDTIQKGIDAAIEGQRVVVFPGTYDEYVSFNGKNIVLTSVNPVDPEIVNATIICDGSRYDAVTFSGSEGPDASLRGLTIMSRGIGSLDLGIGSRGIYGSGTLATIEHCVITGFRKESVSGGGILGCNGLISHCTISNNTAYAFGGLFRCDGSITNCTISDNTAYARGGGLGFCHGLIENCMITGNMVTGYRYYSDFGFGGGLFNCDGSIMNCTIADNTAYKSGGGLDECNGSIMNCIIWNNTAVISGDQLYESSTPTYSCIQDWAGGGMGNINADPLFVDPVDDWFEGDYHLKSEGWRWDAVAGEWTWDDETSPCVDSGNPGMLLGDELITLDVDPLNRWGENIRINMGVYGGTPEASMAPPGWALLCDLDNSGNVNLSDFAPLAAAWMQTAQNQPPDVTRDGTVDLGDLITLTDDWLSN